MHCYSILKLRLLYYDTPLAKAYLGEIWLWLRMKVTCLGVSSIQERRNMPRKYTSPSSELFQKYYPNS